MGGRADIPPKMASRYSFTLRINSPPFVSED
jgi:hypothetical protein